MTLTRKEFLKATNGRSHDEELHFPSSAQLFWFINGTTYCEVQPDIGPVRWWCR